MKTFNKEINGIKKIINEKNNYKLDSKVSKSVFKSKEKIVPNFNSSIVKSIFNSKVKRIRTLNRKYYQDFECFPTKRKQKSTIGKVVKRKTKIAATRAKKPLEKNQRLTRINSNGDQVDISILNEFNLVIKNLQPNVVLKRINIETTKVQTQLPSLQVSYRL